MNSSVPNTVNYRDFLCMCAACLHGDGPCEGVTLNLITGKVSICCQKRIIPPNLSIWKTIHKMPQEQPNWETILHIMSTFQSFDGLKNYMLSHPLQTLTCTINADMSEVDREHLDFVALHHVPDDAPQGYASISIEADGNCFPQTLIFCVSILIGMLRCM